MRPPRFVGRGPAHDLARDRDRHPHVQPEDEVEVFAGDLGERRLLVGAEVVHEHVDAAERGPRLGDEPLGFAVREQVGLDVAGVLVVAEQA